MKKIGLFYSKSTVKTAQIAKKILAEFDKGQIESVTLEDAWEADFEKYDNLILGAATWFDGELPDAWDELIPKIKTINFKGKKAAIFGLGNQKGYPDNFVDSIGLLADVFEECGANIVGFTSTEGYEFEKSAAVRNGKFCGLAIDFENQNKLTDKRVKDWVENLKNEFN